ncbi:unnamed protein product [Clonostachys rosea]|uniref:Altered inheritance of mitochondria protein 21 n=1 Tax=Bionectria ochroleuca TaxID=29856 RepID=A0ABY6U7V5_BIOOC|nr:unnamed protein product [Clonostachys rosea]
MTATVQPTPIVPPRPSRKSPDKDSSSASMPKVPPRPARKQIDRAVSPNPERFAPSPFHEGNFSKNEPLLSPSYSIHEPVEDPIDRAGSVPMPSVGEEGVEYSAVQEEVQKKAEGQLNPGTASPEHTSTVADDLHLHAPKPSLPADSAKQRVQVVTRTDSDRAASFGIGRAASRDGVKKKPSTSLSTGSDNETPLEEEHGIPEIGKRVPMNPHLGDVQAPSFPDNEAPLKGHQRKHSSRGLPPGSYGLHGHGVGPQDKLQKAYYEKNPDARKKDEYTPIHDPQNNYAMTSAELNKLVRETASRGAGVGTSSEYRSTPTDEVGFQASEEYANRISTPRPTSSAANGKSGSSTSSRPDIVLPEGGKDTNDEAIHVDDPSHPEYRHPSAHENTIVDTEEYQAPILAADEVASDSRAYHQKPAVHPPPARVGSAFEMEDAPSRPTSRPVSMHQESHPEIRTTPLDDVEEYEPLFPEGKDGERRKADDSKTHRPFPSKDVWEDAPNSAHYTATVSTPDVPEPGNERSRSSGSLQDRPLTPAHAFALKQEQLAEEEAKGGRAKGLSPTFVPSSEDKQSHWGPHLAHLRSEVKPERPSSGHRFPSRDVWEDVPESHVYEATIESPQDEPKPEEANPDEDSKTEETTPAVPARPTRKSPESSERPAVPNRPKPKQTPSDEKLRPAVSEKPKPQIPTRPSKGLSSDSKDAEASKAKPPVPSRPVGGKIAALQAGFMSDLNKRLQLGPQAPKKEEAPAPDALEVAEEKEKVPLSDARKGRARGPQRRAPAKSPAPATSIATETKTAPLSLSISSSISVWSISPDVGHVHVKGDKVDKSQITPASVDTTAEVPAKLETKSDTVAAPEPEPVKVEVKDEVKDESKEKLDEETESKVADTTEVETKTLAANTAGESILEATVEKTAEGSEVEPLTVKDEVKP